MEESAYMAKMKVHELAKELEIKSQEIIELLTGTEYEVKAANSNLEDAAQDVVRKKFHKEVTAPKADKPVQTAKPEASSKAEAPAAKPAGENGTEAHERPKKKSSITAVFNAQYSKQGNTHGGQRRPGQQGGNRMQGDRRPQNGRPARPAGEPPRPAKPMSGNDMRKYFDSLINPNAGKTAEPAAKEAEAATEVKTESASATVKPIQERVLK